CLRSEVGVSTYNPSPGKRRPTHGLKTRATRESLEQRQLLGVVDRRFHLSVGEAGGDSVAGLELGGGADRLAIFLAQCHRVPPAEHRVRADRFELAREGLHELKA